MKANFLSPVVVYSQIWLGVLPAEKVDGKLAALDAGFSKSMADHASTKIETRDVKEAFAALIREAVPPERIVKVISEGLEAMETKFFAEKGVVKDERDVISWPERRQYAELAAEYGGYHIPEKGERETGGGVILILPDTTPSSAPIIEGAPVNREAGPMLILPNSAEQDTNA